MEEKYTPLPGEAFHIHTKRCGHASGEDREYIEKAIELGAPRIVFTDHAPFPGNPFRNRMIVEELPEYMETFRRLKEEYAGKIEIMIGLECEYLPGFHSYYIVVPYLLKNYAEGTEKQMYMAAVQCCFTNLERLDDLSDPPVWHRETGGFWGNPGVLFIQENDDGSTQVLSRLFIGGEIYDTIEEAKAAISSPGSMNFSPVFDEMLGDG